jgi:HK97 family phage prohead protease
MNDASSHLTLEERRRLAQSMGTRVAGSTGGDLRVAGTGCARCGDRKVVTIPCPVCGDDTDTDGDDDVGGDGRQYRQRKAEGLGGIERRTFSLAKLEVREAAGGSSDMTLEGWAATTGMWYEVAPFEEMIVPGAFKRTLGENPDVSLLVGHSGLPLARSRAGTLDLSEDGRGLRVVARLDPHDDTSAMVARKLSRGDLDGQMSFAFQATGQSWNEDFTRRTIQQVSLHRGDVSIVVQGANPFTTSTISTGQAGELVGAGSRAAVSTLTRGNREKERVAVLRAGPIARPARAMPAAELAAQQIRTRSAYERDRIAQLRKGA